MTSTKERIITPKTKEILDTLNAEERASYCLEDRWISYPAADRILDELRFVLNRPKTRRPSGMAIIGHGFNGKTELLAQFVLENQTERFDDRVNVRILDIETPPTPSLSMLYSEILARIGDPQAESNTSKVQLSRLKILLQRLQVECIVVDEIHDILTGAPGLQKAFLNMLKKISNKIKVPIIVTGTSDVSAVVSKSFQVETRYPIYVIPLWDTGAELEGFLVRLEATLPLKKESRLWEMAGELYGLSGAVIGNIVGIVRRAASEAILLGEEKITLKLLQKSAQHFVKPRAKKTTPKG